MFSFKVILFVILIELVITYNVSFWLGNKTFLVFYWVAGFTAYVLRNIHSIPREKVIFIRTYVPFFYKSVDSKTGAIVILYPIQKVLRDRKGSLIMLSDMKKMRLIEKHKERRIKKDGYVEKTHVEEYASSLNAIDERLNAVENEPEQGAEVEIGDCLTIDADPVTDYKDMRYKIKCILYFNVVNKTQFYEYASTRDKFLYEFGTTALDRIARTSLKIKKLIDDKSMSGLLKSRISGDGEIIKTCGIMMGDIKVVTHGFYLPSIDKILEVASDIKKTKTVNGGMVTKSKKSKKKESDSSEEEEQPKK